MNDQKTYGKITVGYKTSFQKELNIIEFIQAHYKDNRVIAVSQVEDGSFVVAVENLKSSGRNPQSIMWLSKESMLGMVATIMLYFEAKGEDIKTIFAESVTNGEDISYSFSENLDASQKD